MRRFEVQLGHPGEPLTRLDCRDHFNVAAMILQVTAQAQQ
jgi:hypothetical protein